MQELIQELQLPSAYPFPVDQVQVIETHISWVFLAGPFAYKVKKPVNFGFVDYSEPEQRRAYCEEEVRLNRRLAPNVYLGVVPIARWGGVLRVEGAGDVVEFAVKMRRLPRERMLDALLARDQVSLLDIERLAGRIAAFHREVATSASIDHFGSRQVIEQNWRENFAQAQPFVGHWLTHGQFRRIYSFVQHELEHLDKTFEQRIRDGRIRDCHGDLRSDSVFMDADGGFEIFDCIEFNDRFRYGDVASEVAFLASDLDGRGRPDLAWSWVEAYVEASGDHSLREVLPFYKCYRAFVRGKVEALEERTIAIFEQRHAHGRAAREHFELAESYTLRFAPTLFLTCGPPGAGKTTLARGVASILGLPVISSDRVRKELAGCDPRAHGTSVLDEGLYGPETTRRTYDELYARARRLLASGQGVILDATFGRATERQAAVQLARQVGAAHIFLSVEAPESRAFERLTVRAKDREAESDAGPELFAQLRGRFEPINPGINRQLVHVPLDGTIQRAVQVAVDGIRQHVSADYAVKHSA